MTSLPVAETRSRSYPPSRGGEPTVGLGLKAQHYEDALACSATGLWFEVHAENYMVSGGPRLAWLEAIRHEKPLSLHGVGLSLAGDASPDAEHLARLRALIERYEPFLVSEHLAWSLHGGVYHPDLLPFPRTRQRLARIADNISRTQDALGRSILIENPSLYLALKGHETSEAEFLADLVTATGCGLLLDVNNVHVTANNLGGDAFAYIDALPAQAIGEIHLAGHAVDERLGPALLIDTHDAPIAEAVWDLYGHTLGRIGPRPTLIERDGNLPSFETLMAERGRAVALLTLERNQAHG
ncbi:MNIO family bufferin maturase [Brevundimonas sp.]|uniref:MNIO family bufferin maturase n=1 Tax=Brevundimonas sp. TaxID=1871086 RepID=UPI003F708F8F